MNSFSEYKQVKKNPTKENLEWILLLLSSALLGIWAVKETIALRHVLLFCGVLFSVYYIRNELKEGQLREEVNTWEVLPIILILTVFIWVLIHYFLFSIDQNIQFQELKSTWLRSFLATIFGLGAGLALNKYPNRLNILWVGIFLSFLVLLCQYTPRAITQKNLLITDYDNYIFHLKINTVLAGSILLAGISGSLFDHLRFTRSHQSYITVWLILYWLASSIIVLWAFVYIVNARNGIGLSILLYIFWFVCGIIFLMKGRRKPKFISYIGLVLLIISSLVIMFFTIMQIKINPGWSTLIHDAKIAIEIDRYPHYQDTIKMGYPSDETGKTVTPNNYERIAWATAGTRAILQYPQGVGVLAHPFSMHPNAPKKLGENIPILGIATHSGWVELGLAFGLPILILIFSVIGLIFFGALINDYPAKMMVLGMLVLIIGLYTTGEVAIDHGLEMLFYLLSLLASLLLVKTKSRTIPTISIKK